MAMIAEALECYKRIQLFNRDCIAATQPEREVAKQKIATIDNILNT